ncbi:hypothetical protein VNO80_05910 [Phaseolus coccineus]|uniref:Uncharacterized protein n=1 Tax=Phaseolus coccineus TaxID=3886 RepID=A0AAN9RI99_PHACN
MMRNNKMKSIGIVIMMMMMMLSCTEGSDIIPEKSCSAKCAPGCVFANLAYPICYAICIDKCKHPDPPSVYSDCFSSCNIIIKSSSNNIGLLGAFRVYLGKKKHNATIVSVNTSVGECVNLG